MERVMMRHDKGIQRRIRGLALMLFICLPLLLAGCAVGPDYVRPEVETPAVYKENKGWKVAEPKDGAVKGAWWDIFNDPKLGELMKQVNVSNQNIKVAEAQYRQAEGLARESRAGLFPVVGLSATGSRYEKKSFSSSRLVTTGDYQLSGSVSWEIDLWGKIRRGVEAGEAGAAAGAADLESVRLSMQASLAQYYFQLRFLDSQKQLLDATVAEYRKNLVLTENRYQGGIASKADVYKAQTQLKTTEAQAIDIRVQRAQLEHAIAVLVGKPASSFSIPFSPLDVAPPAMPVGVPSEILERRPDIAAAERRMAAANARIGVAMAAYYPSITLDGSGGFDGSQFSKWLVWPSRFWSVGGAAAQTLLDFGRRGAQTEQATALYDESVASYRQTVLTAFQEVEDNLAALRILEEEAAVQGEAVKASSQSVKVSMNQYKAGIVSYLDVVTALTAQLSNEVGAISIKNRRMAACVLLIKALGGGWEAADLKKGPQDKH
jgi:NodT family efflux transporter outer membrane factor (OMF) lipoprotein